MGLKQKELGVAFAPLLPFVEGLNDVEFKGNTRQGCKHRLQSLPASIYQCVLMGFHFLESQFHQTLTRNSQRGCNDKEV